MVHTLPKIKLLKLTLLGAFGAGVVASLIAKEMRKKKKTEDIDDQITVLACELVNSN